jgi:hypothetical protein
MHMLHDKMYTHALQPAGPRRSTLTASTVKVLMKLAREASVVLSPIACSSESDMSAKLPPGWDILTRTLVHFQNGSTSPQDGQQITQAE